MKTVGRIADSRHEQLKNILERANNRAEIFLADVLIKCLAEDTLDKACAVAIIGEYLHTETAAGAILFHDDNNEPLVIGTPAVSVSGIGNFQSGQLAGIQPLSPDQGRIYYVIAKDENRTWRLLVSYRAALIQPVFTNRPGLGKSGETFLADANGYFITAPRYPADQGKPSHPISAQPMQACLNRQDGEVLDYDYRGTKVIHGFRYIPEIGGGCIMAHIDQEEVFAPLQTLEKKLLAILLLFMALSLLISNFIAKRMVKPIVQLTATARRIRDGDLSVRAEGRRQRGNRRTGQLVQSHDRRAGRRPANLGNPHRRTHPRTGDQRRTLYAGRRRR